MELHKRLALAVLLLASIVFVALFGRVPALSGEAASWPLSFRRLDETHRRGHLGWPHIPGIVQIRPLPDGGEPPSGVEIFFLGIMALAETTFLQTLLPQMSQFQCVVAGITILTPYWLCYKTTTCRASMVSADNHDREMKRYPYDHIIFHPDQMCITCRRLKPARSKHCGACGVCVAKHDHHCAWVRTCLGRANYRYFLALLTSLGVLLSYGSYLAWRAEKAIVRQLRSSGMDGTYHVWTEAFASDVQIGSVGLLALLTCPLAWGLLFYNLYLIWAGMTTNESAKWANLRDCIADGLIYKRSKHTSAPSQWPVSSRMELCSSDEPPMDNAWTRVRSLEEVDNLYDLGWFDNLHMVLTGK